MIIKIQTDRLIFENGDTHVFKEPIPMDRFKEASEVIDAATRTENLGKPPGKDWVRDLGGSLFRHVFPNDHRFREPMILDIAPELRELPWEFLHDGRRFLALNPGIIRLVRDHGAADAGSRKTDPVTGRKLHVKVMMASPLLSWDPDDPSLGAALDEKGRYKPDALYETVLNFRRELQSFEDLRGGEYPVLFDIHRGTRKSVFRDALNSSCDILSFSGHGNSQSLLLETEIATADNFSIEDVYSSGVHRDIRAAVLIGCKTAAVPASEAEPESLSAPVSQMESAWQSTPSDGKSIAEALCSEGVPWVIAMNHSITQEAGQLFSRHFYGKLSEGRGILESVTAARRAMADDKIELKSWEFASPVLFAGDAAGWESPLYQKGETQAAIEVKISGAMLTERREERFAGRRRELVSLAKALRRDSACKGALLHGPGGIGKTAMALEAAYRFGGAFCEVIFAGARKELPGESLRQELKGAGESRKIGSVADYFRQIIREFEAVGRPVDVGEAATPGELMAKIADHCNAPGRRLLILDNLEDLASDEKEGSDDHLHSGVVGLLEKLDPGRCRVVLTTRVDFRNVSREYVRIPVHPLESRESGEFFHELFSGEPGTPDWEKITSAFNRVGGHPLALKMAVAWMEEGWPMNEILTGLTEAGEEVWRYIAEKTVNRLPETERKLYMALSMFSSSGRLKAIESVTGFSEKTCRDALSLLVRFSVVQKRTGRYTGVYYGVFALLRDDAAKRLHAVMEWERELKDRFGRWVEDELGALGEIPEEPGGLPRMRLDEEIWNYIAGAGYRRDLGSWDEAMDAYRKCAAIADVLGEPSVRSVLLNNMGVVLVDQGDWDGALTHYHNSLEILERIGDVHGMAQTLVNMGNVLAKEGDWDGALTQYRNSLKTFERIGDVHGMAQTLGNMGHVLAKKGNLDGALTHYRNSLETFERIGDVQGMASTYNNMGHVLAKKGNLDGALTHYRNSLETFERIGDVQGMASTYNNMGVVLADQGDWEGALTHYRNSLETFERIGDVHGMAQTYNNMGVVLADQGDWDGALTHYRNSLEVSERIGDVHGMAQTYNNMGLVLVDQGDWDGALTHYRNSLEISDRIGDVHGMAQTYNNMGSVYYRQGDWDGALTHYRNSLEIKERIGDVHGMAQTYNNMGNVLAKKGDWEGALTQYRNSLEIKERIGDVHGMASTYNNMGSVYYRQGDWDGALTHYRNSLEIKDRIGDVHGMAQTRFNMALILQANNKIPEAIEQAETALKIYTKLGSPYKKNAEELLAELKKQSNNKRK